MFALLHLACITKLGLGQKGLTTRGVTQTFEFQKPKNNFRKINEAESLTKFPYPFHGHGLPVNFIGGKSRWMTQCLYTNGKCVQRARSNQDCNPKLVIKRGDEGWGVGNRILVGWPVGGHRLPDRWHAPYKGIVAHHPLRINEPIMVGNRITHQPHKAVRD